MKTVEIRKMQTFCIKSSRNDLVLSSCYHDAYIHTEDKKIFNVHKVLVAMYSPFLHEYFQSRPGNNVNDIFFQNVHSLIVKPAIELIYNGTVSVECKYLKPFRYFLETTLQIQLQENDSFVIPNPVEIIELSSKDQKCDQTVEDKNFQNTAGGSHSGPLTRNDQQVDDEQDTYEFNDDVQDSINLVDDDGDCSSSLNSGWTLTSISPKKMMMISHSVTYCPNKRNVYTCDLCGKKTREFSEAKNHFVRQHQSYLKEKQQLESARDARKNCLTKLNSIKNDIEKGYNIAIARNMLRKMSEELSKPLDIIDNIEKTKLIAENLSRKSRELSKALNGTIREIGNILKDYDK